MQFQNPGSCWWTRKQELAAWDKPNFPDQHYFRRKQRKSNTYTEKEKNKTKQQRQKSIQNQNIKAPSNNDKYRELGMLELVMSTL